MTNDEPVLRDLDLISVAAVEDPPDPNTGFVLKED